MGKVEYRGFDFLTCLNFGRIMLSGAVYGKSWLRKPAEVER